MAENHHADPGHVLITGASSGIGREMAKLFVSRGFHPVLLSRRREALQELAQELKTAFGAHVTLLPADLDDPAAPQAIFNRLAERGVKIEILVNNAGIMAEGDFAAIPLAGQRSLLQINIAALTSLTYLFLQPMLARAHGRILNIASIAAFAPAPTLAVYAASKAYVLSFTEALSQELQGTGVSITALCPGFTNTPMVRASPRAAQLSPLLIGEAAEVARQGVEACLAGEPLHIPGAANALAAAGAGLLPRSLLRAAGGLAARRLAP